MWMMCPWASSRMLPLCRSLIWEDTIGERGFRVRTWQLEGPVRGPKDGVGVRGCIEDGALAA